eukprot:3115001-Prymnesium_polylepis.1
MVRVASRAHGFAGAVAAEHEEAPRGGALGARALVQAQDDGVSGARRVVDARWSASRAAGVAAQSRGERRAVGRAAAAHGRVALKGWRPRNYS